MQHHFNDDSRPIRPAWFAGIAIGALCALLVWPHTHRLVAGQLRLVVPTPRSIAAASPVGFTDSAISDYVWPTIRKCADEHPDDLDQQIAAATTIPVDRTERALYPPYPDGSRSGDYTFKLKRLQGLIPRFADQPALYATLLRYTTLGKVRCTREDKDQFLPDTNPGPSAAMLVPIPHSSPADVYQFDTECAAAERLDPDNGFFPALRSIGLFEAHRDGDAVAALERAAACSHWMEYLNDEFNGELTLQAEAFGTPGPLPRAAFAAAILLPHLASIRAVSRITLYEAVEAEQAGHLADGLRMRTAVRRVGSLMRSESQNLIGSLVGMSLVKMSLMRPAGAAAGPKADVLKQKDIRDSLLRNFDSYLASAGSSGDSASVRAEMEACVKTREIISAGMGRSVFDTDLTSVLVLNITDMIVLSSVVWLAALAGLIWSLAAIAGSKPVKRLPRICRFALVIVLALAAGFATTALLVQQADGSVGTIARMGQVWFSSEDGTTPPHNAAMILCDGYMGIVATIPVLTVLTLAVLCLIWRAPVMAGVARGIRGSILPLCSVLMIGYVVLASITAAYESRLDSRLTESFVHEGRATARLVGAEWPGIVK